MSAAVIAGRTTRVRLPGAVRFAVHAAEMVAAMVLGMVVLGVPVRLVAAGLGEPDLARTQPFVAAIVMLATMTLPMAAWMHIRGHERRMILEMSAAMAGSIVVVLVVAAPGSCTSGRSPAGRTR